jgi:hypothetical protein
MKTFKEIPLNKCKKMTKEELDDYANDYMMHSYEYSHKLNNIIEEKELEED